MVLGPIVISTGQRPRGGPVVKSVQTFAAVSGGPGDRVLEEIAHAVECMRAKMLAGLGDSEYVAPRAEIMKLKILFSE